MSLGPMELALLLGIALLVFGPSKLPALGKSLGEAIRGFKKGMETSDEEPQKRGPSEQVTGAHVGDQADTDVKNSQHTDKNKV